MPKIIIIGNSAAGFSVCENLVKNPSHYEITVISKEEYPAYKRNLLIDYLNGTVKDDGLFLCAEDYYKKNNITFYPQSEVERIDTKKQRAVLKDNNKINYDYLIIASGSKIELPDIPGKTKDGVLAFYTLKDVKDIQKKLMLVQTVCIIGESPIVLRIAELLAAKDKEVKVISRLAFDLGIQNDKIELISGVEPQEFIGEGELQALKLTSGKVIGTSLVLFTGNYIPCADFLKDTEIKVEQGYVIVDANMRTNLENVFACGSVCRNAGGLTREKSWEEAANEGVKVAQNLIHLSERGETLCQQTS